MKKRIASLTLALALVFSLSVSASAAPRWDQFGDCILKLSFSGSTANCYVSMTCGSTTKQMSVAVYLEKEKSDGSYSYEKIWREDVYGNEYRLDDSVTGCASGDYRLRVVAIAYDTKGSSETITNETFNNC